MKKVVALAIIAISFGASASQDEGKKLFTDAIVNAKFAGTCAAYKQMAEFQSATQMPGGDEFINRFGATEVARLGMTLKEFTELCTKAIQNYNEMKRISEES
ncbi:hypothetical protein [Serratia marcescens]|uniref:hypothetical protein n=1 Tax=Serratia marcescens TaxID=615 RepID=UPI0025AA7AC4|nr:hypothetical protein [Serratia marcescens]MDN0031234.1 hypothetical protein [Serratia marcescens]